MNHPMDGLTGLEIYNRHWDAKKDMASVIVLAFKLLDPAELAELQENLRLYPDELLASQVTYLQDYIGKWDTETQKRRLTGVAANDCHHNQVFIVKMQDEDTILIGTIVDKDSGMRKLTAASRPAIRELTKGHKPGDILVRARFRSLLSLFPGRGDAHPGAGIDRERDSRRAPAGSRLCQPRLDVRRHGILLCAVGAGPGHHGR